MMKHFVLNLNPSAQFEWERCSLHHPITAEQPDFAELIAASVRESVQNPERSSSYLIAVKLEVVVLESSVAESMADQVSEAIPNTVPNSFPNSIAIPLIEAGRSVRSVPERLAGVA
jgi:hypothetical protein